jgi:hypothetical protein
MCAGFHTHDGERHVEEDHEQATHVQERRASRGRCQADRAGDDANDKARADALAKLNAKPAATINAATDRGSKASTTSAPKPATKTTAKLKPKRLSALDAAAQVLQALPAKEARLGLSASELIERMAAAGLWTSPSGKTPAATLYAAMIRESHEQGRCRALRAPRRHRWWEARPLHRIVRCGIRHAQGPNVQGADAEVPEAPVAEGGCMSSERTKTKAKGRATARNARNAVDLARLESMSLAEIRDLWRVLGCRRSRRGGETVLVARRVVEGCRDAS